MSRRRTARARFNKPGVASVEPATRFAALLDQRIGQFTGMLRITATLSGQTWSTTLVLGVLVVASAPLLNTRKLTRMDIRATLRVIE